MKYNFIAKVLILINFFSFEVYSQDIKMKKSELNDLMEDLRLRKKSLELERTYLINFLDSINDLDSLQNELRKCKEFYHLDKGLDMIFNYDNLFGNSKNQENRYCCKNRKYSKD